MSVIKKLNRMGVYLMKKIKEYKSSFKDGVSATN